MRVLSVTAMVCVACATFVESPTPVRAQPIMFEDQVIVAADTAPGDRFGFSLDMDSDTLVVGAIQHDAHAINAGAAYVFVNDGFAWIEHTKILPPAGEPGDWFGYAVAIDDDRIVVGSQFADVRGVDSGAAFVYRNTGGTWTLEASLSPPELRAGDLLGHSVAIEGSVIVIGAERDDTMARDAGAAYVYRYDGTAWQPEAKLVASGGSRNDFFGHDVAVSGNTIGVGAERTTVKGHTTAGAVSMFEFDSASATWLERDTLIAPLPQADAFFGHAIEIDLPWILVGAAFHDGVGVDSGAAYLFERHDDGVYAFRHEFRASDGAAGDQFGSHLDIAGPEIVIGAESAWIGTSPTGAAHLFATRDDRWVPHARFRPTAASSGARFGRAVAITDKWVACGAFEDDAVGVRSGAVFLSRLPLRPPITTSGP